MVSQYRHPIRQTTLELPAGTREVDEPALSCAARELREETGLDVEDLVGQPVRELSLGERMRMELIAARLHSPDLLLLDEPTNDLDVDTLRALESGLDAFAGCAVIISHDRWFLDRVATNVLAFEGDSAVRWFEGNFSEYEAVRHRELGTDSAPTRMRYTPVVRA